MPEFYSTQDVADRLGVSIFTIRRYIQAGKLEAIKLDGGYRVSRTALDAFLSLRATPTADPPADASADAASTDARGVAEPPRHRTAAAPQSQPAPVAHD